MDCTIEQKSMLMSALSGYRRRFSFDEAKYDDYHERIRPDGEAFKFSIQVFDSPEGDTWWYGRFRLIDDVDVELLESRYERT